MNTAYENEFEKRRQGRTGAAETSIHWHPWRRTCDDPYANFKRIRTLWPPNQAEAMEAELDRRKRIARLRAEQKTNQTVKPTRRGGFGFLSLCHVN
jgi:hypothetical protein